MLDIEDILETQRMFDKNKLDVRTITMEFLFWDVLREIHGHCAEEYTTVSAERRSIWLKREKKYPGSTGCLL